MRRASPRGEGRAKPSPALHRRDLPRLPAGADPAPPAGQGPVPPPRRRGVRGGGARASPSCRGTACRNRPSSRWSSASASAWPSCASRPVAATPATRRCCCSRSSGKPSTAAPSTSPSPWSRLAATLALPIVLIGGDGLPGQRAARRHPRRRSTFTVAAVTVQKLLARIRLHEDMLAEVVQLTRGLDEHPRHPPAPGHRHQGHHRGRRRRVLRGRRHRPAPHHGRDRPVDGRAGRRRPASWADGAPARRAALRPADGPRPGPRSAPCCTSRSCRGTHGVALVTLGWSDRRRQPPTFARQAVELVAAEAAVAIERADLIERVTRLARHDDLTGLANRRTWDEHLIMEMSRADRTGSSPLRRDPRPRPLQVVQRRARPPRRRPAAEGGGGRMERAAPPDRPAGPLGRRGVRPGPARNRPRPARCR